MSTCFAVLGLGEAGSAIAMDLVAAGADVRGYDPAVQAPDGVTGCRSEADAVAGANVVLSVNSADDASVALGNGVAALRPGSVWADLNTAAAGRKLELAELLSQQQPGASFVDVALMAPVPGRGLRTPMLASGAGAADFRAALTPLGATVEVLDGGPGQASTRKLLRSVFFKGLAAAVVEALTAAEAVGLADWLRENIAEELTRSDAGTVDRLVAGSVRHAIRRSHEMAAAAQLLHELGVPARVAEASRDLLEQLAAEEAMA